MNHKVKQEGIQRFQKPLCNKANEVLAAFHQYQMPVIELGRRTSREAVCLVFEKVNTGGKKLDAFELLTAIYAVEEEGFHLREEWAVIAKRLSDSIALKEQPLTRLQATDFFQALALLYTQKRRLTHVATNRAGDPPCHQLHARYRAGRSAQRVQAIFGKAGRGVSQGW